MTISLPAALLARAEARATARGITLNELIAVAVREHLARGFRLITVKGELVDRQVDLNRTSDLMLVDDQYPYGESNLSA